MNPAVVFLIGAFITALTLCVAAFFTNSTLLYSLGAVIAIASALTAMWCTAITDLNPKEEDQ